MRTTMTGTDDGCARAARRGPSRSRSRHGRTRSRRLVLLLLPETATLGPYRGRATRSGMTTSFAPPPSLSPPLLLRRRREVEEIPYAVAGSGRIATMAAPLDASIAKAHDGRCRSRQRHPFPLSRSSAAGTSEEILFAAEREMTATVASLDASIARTADDIRQCWSR